LSVGSRLKVDSVGRVLTGVFYTVVGVVLFVAFAFSNFPPHVAILGVLSLVTAYGVFVKRGWALYAVFVVLFVGSVFATYMLYYLWSINWILELGIVVYLALMWIAAIYVWAKRKTLEV
jgi:hypothetical protein